MTNTNIEYSRLLGRRTIDSTKFVIDPRKGHAAIALHLSRKNYALGIAITIVLKINCVRLKIFWEKSI